MEFRTAFVCELFRVKVGIFFSTKHSFIVFLFCFFFIDLWQFWWQCNEIIGKAADNNRNSATV